MILLRIMKYEYALKILGILGVIATVCVGLRMYVFSPVAPACAPLNAFVCVTEPAPGASIVSPLVVRGEARGNWFFEATFPVILTDWDGKIIAEGYAQADGEWMTSEFVPFTATVNFEKPPYGERGTVILKKDNPSGLPEHDDAVEFFITFK